MNPAIRPLELEDEPFLWEMLYRAIYISPGSKPPAREIIYQPELARYVKNWGRAGDKGFIAIDRAGDRPLGAVWLRLMTAEEPGYGYIDSHTPELSIAVFPEDRGLGIGTALMTELLRSQGQSSISLSVSGDNPARKLYDRCGFQIVSENGDSLTMKRD